MNTHAHSHAHAPSPSLLGAPPSSALPPAPSGLVWYGLNAAPRGVRWVRAVSAGNDGTYTYWRTTGMLGSEVFAAIVARPMIGGLTSAVYYYVAARVQSKRTGSPPASPGALGQPYDGNPDNPYPPYGPGWYETTFDDQGARSEAASMLGALPPNHYVDRLLPTGLYRLFAFETAAGQTAISALRYYGSASTLGQEPNIAPPGGSAAPNANNSPAIQAAQGALDYLSQNGCPAQGTFVQQIADMQNAYNASGLGPQITPDGDYGPNSQAALQLILNSVNPPAGTAPTNCYNLPVPAVPGPNAPATPAGPSAGPTRAPAGDIYASLTPAQQSAFRSALFASLNSNACPTVDVSSVTSADTLTDLSTRAVAVDCYQTQHGIGAAAGVLDTATYNAIMGVSPVAKAGVSGGAIALGAAGVLTLGALAVAAATGQNPLSWIRT